MASISLTWDPNPTEEQVSGYRVFQDGESKGEVAGPSATIDNVTPGRHIFEVSAVNPWGESQRAGIETPAMCTRPVNLKLSITVDVSV